MRIQIDYLVVARQSHRDRRLAAPVAPMAAQHFGQIRVPSIAGVHNAVRRRDNGVTYARQIRGFEVDLT
jgi:hypothetical protein